MAKVTGNGDKAIISDLKADTRLLKRSTRSAIQQFGMVTECLMQYYQDLEIQDHLLKHKWLPEAVCRSGRRPTPRLLIHTARSIKNQLEEIVTLIADHPYTLQKMLPRFEQLADPVPPAQGRPTTHSLSIIELPKEDKCNVRKRNVRIDMSRWFQVPLNYAQLLAILAMDTSNGQPPPPDDDGLVGFKPIAEIIQIILDRYGQIDNRRSIINRVDRIHQRLKAAGIDPDLLECQRGCGYRLRLWRGRKDI